MPANSCCAFICLEAVVLETVDILTSAGGEKSCLLCLVVIVGMVRNDTYIVAYTLGPQGVLSQALCTLGVHLPH